MTVYCSIRRSSMAIQDNPSPPVPSWTRRHTVGCFLSLIGIVFVGLFPIPRLITWWLFLLIMGAFTVIVSDGVTGSFPGLLIDERHRMSLSRLQMALWMLVIVSAFLAAAIGNVRVGA